MSAGIPSADAEPVPTVPAPSVSSVSATVVVDPALSLTWDDDPSFTIQAAPGTTGDGEIDYRVVTNNLAGYTVTIAATSPDLTLKVDAGNSDVIPAADITATDDGHSTVLSTIGAMLYSQAVRSGAAGDMNAVRFSANLPFVSTGVYTGTVVFTVTAD